MKKEEKNQGGAVPANLKKNWSNWPIRLIFHKMVQITKYYENVKKILTVKKKT